ncbi:MAG: heavy metal sensor histidine kinase [Vulcanimicrobiota bacterium]
MNQAANRNNSLVVRLAVMFAVSAALLLTALGSTTYWLLDHEFRKDETRVLDDTVALLQTIFRQNEDLVETLQREIPLDMEALHFHQYQLRILDEHGATLYETRRFPPLSRTFLSQLPLYQEGKLGEGALWQQGEASFLVVQALAIREKGSQEKIRLQVALDTSQKTRTLTNYLRVLYLLVSLGVLLAAFLAGLISRRGLRPLSLMTRLVQRLKVDQLHQRFSSRRWPQELIPLAQEFDRLLDEIQVGMERLSHFSTDLAHELRTPLASMMLQAEVTLAQERSLEVYQEVLGSSVEELERLSTLVERLLLLARTEAARPHLEPQQIAVRDLVENLVEYHLTAHPREQVVIQVPEDAVLVADRRLVEMALGNLLSNASKYSTFPVRIEWIEHANEWIIAVQDRGPGIAAEHLPYLFDRLYRVDTSRTSASHGLGLALVRSAMRAHGGEVNLHSAVGQGSRFQLHFPRPNANITFHSAG